MIDFRLTFGVVWVAWVLGRHVDGRRTRALQHHDQFDLALRRRNVNDGPRKGGGSVEEGKPTPIPPDPRIRAHAGGELDDPFSATVYVYDYLLIIVQHSDDDTTALIASASFHDHVRLFGQGKEGVTPILAPNKSTEWDATIDALGFTINSHTMRISFPRKQGRRDEEVAA